MVFIDVHCHLHYYNDKEIEEIIRKSVKEKVNVILDNGTNPESNRKVLELSKRYKEIKCAMGIYPIEALKLKDDEIDKEIDFIKKNKKNIIAIGEVGIDLKEDLEFERQNEIFRKFIELAKEIDKPITVHSREAEKQCIEILEEMQAKKVIMHCFSGKMKLAQKIADNNWYLSVPASVKYNEHFQKIVSLIPVENLLCETDSPYLHPDREQKNYPSNVIESYKKIAEIKKLSLKETERIIENNFKALHS
ncbi:MAG: TatD family hydrolase [Nanoarchaeota archaeon]